MSNVDQEQSEEELNRSNATTRIDPCPICLAPTLRESFLDKCFHKFCFNCVVQWSKVVSGKHCRKLASLTCPLCKTENFSIVHGFDGISFQRHYIDRDLETGFVFSKAHKYRLQCYYTEPGFVDDVFNVSRFWRLRKYVQPNRWLESWLRREIQALMQEEDVDVVLHHIRGIIDSFISRTKQVVTTKTPELIREEFRASVSDAATPFVAARTERFIQEVELFLASGLSIEAYDAVCKQRLGWSEPSSISNDAEVGLGDQKPAIPYLYIFDDDSD